MSIWGDIRKKSLGQEKRLEDTAVDEGAYATREEVNKLISQGGNFIVYAGELPAGQINGNRKGALYIVKEICSIDDKTFYPGSMVIDTGNGYEVIGYQVDDSLAAHKADDGTTYNTSDCYSGT